MWSLDWAEETFPDSEFTFHVLLKVGDQSYEEHGFTDEPSEAFALRRELIGETGITNYFVRARRIIKTNFYAETDSDQSLDFFKDKFNEGVGVEDIPRHLRLGYMTYCRTHGRSAR
ncbi:hypothetical protein OAA10_00255 [bacterium]|nr:hypothetical protein [bacterium]